MVAGDGEGASITLVGPERSRSDQTASDAPDAGTRTNSPDQRADVETELLRTVERGLVLAGPGKGEGYRGELARDRAAHALQPAVEVEVSSIGVGMAAQPRVTAAIAYRPGRVR